jgi:hypothetical protein
MAAHWLYTTAARPAITRTATTKEGATEFSVSSGWWFSVKDGAAAYYEADGWMYTVEAKAAFYFA